MEIISYVNCKQYSLSLIVYILICQKALLVKIHPAHFTYLNADPQDFLMSFKHTHR